MKKLLLLALIPVIYFGFNSSLMFENPVMIFDSPRKYIDLSDFQMSVSLDQNLFSIKDVITMAEGSEVVLDKSKLELMKDGFKLSPVVSMDEYVGLGFGSFKLGMIVNLRSNISMKLPYEMMEVLFGNVETTDTKESTFNIFNGGLVAKAGINLGFGIGKNINIGIAGGLYVPMIWFDKNSKAHFLYRSDEDTATVEMKIDGDVRLLSALSSLQNLENLDANKLTSSAGYYLSIGASAKFGNLKMSGGINDISLQPAKLSYEGYSKVSFDASLVNLELNQSNPTMEIPEDLSELASPEEVSIPMKLFAAANYKLSLLNFGAHFKSTTDFEDKEFGGYIDLANILWIDMTNIGPAWKKTLGLNLDLRILRLSASIGAIDYAGLFNFDTSKMTGITISAGFGMGF